MLTYYISASWLIVKNVNSIFIGMIFAFYRVTAVKG
nr:MAG TPA: hypothetical protein [Caudoviricetes sp.]